MTSAARVPTELIDVWTAPSGARLTLRPVLPQDADLEQALVRGLSLRSRTQRFMAPIRELSPDWLARLTQLDFEHHVAVIAETFGIDGTALPVGEARYVVDDDDAEAAEFAIVVADAWRRQGIARRLLEALRCHAAAAGIVRLHGETLADNHAMIALARELGFRAAPFPGDARLVALVADLRSTPRAAPCRQRTRLPAVHAGHY